MVKPETGKSGGTTCQGVGKGLGKACKGLGAHQHPCRHACPHRRGRGARPADSPRPDRRQPSPRHAPSSARKSSPGTRRVASANAASSNPSSSASSPGNAEARRRRAPSPRLAGSRPDRGTLLIVRKASGGMFWNSPPSRDLQRAGLDPVEEATAYARLSKEFRLVPMEETPPARRQEPSCRGRRHAPSGTGARGAGPSQTGTPHHGEHAKVLRPALKGDDEQRLLAEKLIRASASCARRRATRGSRLWRATA